MDSFECAICSEQLICPLVITCGHSFCKKCLEQLKPDQLACPLCRKQFVSVESLPKNFVVQQWIEQNTNTGTFKNEKICENCDVDRASLWCKNCESNICVKCDSTTHSSKITGKHKRITLTEKSKEPLFSKCPRHYEDMKYFCNDDKVFLCHGCVIDDHSAHKTMSVAKFTSGLQNELMVCVAPLKDRELLENVEKAVRIEKKKDEEMLKTLEESVQVLKEKIKLKEVDIKEIMERQERVKTSEVVLLKAIEELSVNQLMDKTKVDEFKRRINEIIKQVYPEKLKEMKIQPCKLSSIQEACAIKNITISGCSSSYTICPPSNMLISPVSDSVYWLSEYGKISDQWVTYDFPNVTTIKTVALIGSSSYNIHPKNFIIQIPGLNGTWCDVHHLELPLMAVSGSWGIFSGFHVQTRSIRLYFKDRHGDNGGRCILLCGVRFF